MRNLIPYCIQECHQQGRYAGEFEALTMFVDVSGFTPMTQTLMQQGHEAAEILATVMNNIFEVLVNAVYERGGFVSTFAGDAFTAIFPLDNDVIPSDELILHVLACVKTFQGLFHQHGIQTTSQGQFPLQFRVGLSGGTVEWGIVGKTSNAYFFRGDAIDGCAASEHQAEKGEVMFDNFVAQRLRQVPGTVARARHLRSLQVDRCEGGYYRLKTLPESFLEEFPLPELPETPELHPDVLARFFPETIIHSTEWGEFRLVVSMFISFAGISTIEAMNAWIGLLLKNINTFGGYFNRINFGDKGGFVLCGFGAPVTYEDTIDRALQCMLSAKQELTGFRNLSTLRFRAGITYGMAYAGIAGGQKRCEYTYHGEVVNLAARLMMKADWGEVFVSDAVRDKTVQFNFAHKGDFLYKGIADPVSTWVLINRKTGIRHQPFTEVMIGRREELQRLQQFAAPIFTHAFAGMVCIYGEAGIGKSRLAYALQEAFMQQHAVTWFNCPADQIVHKPFNPFITCFMRYFEQSSEHTEEENRTRFEEKYETLVEAPKPSPPSFPAESLGVRASEVRVELIRTKSVIGAQLGLSWKGSLWEQLDAKGKYENTVSAIKGFFLAHSLLHPVVIELEDGHWFDSDSLILIHALTQNVSQYPLLLLSTLRYTDYGRKPCLLNPQDLIQRNIPYEHIELQEFSDTDLRNFAEAHLEGKIDEGVYAVLAERTNGNPFFAEQLLHYFLEHGLVEQKDGRWQFKAGGAHLPDTINAVLIARIDCLADEVKDVIKAAAVIGREFEIILLSAMLKGDILSQVQIIRNAQIWEEVRELRYLFKHALLRDIAYGMQLKSRLRQLHQLTAETMETLYATNLAKYYADLAFHYERAEIRDKAIEYLEKAGDEAKAQYQNQQALELYDRLLIQLQDVFGYTEVEIDTLLKKAESLRLIGKWKDCQTVCENALCLSEQIDDTRRMGWVKLVLGIIFRETGNYDNAMTYFEQVLEQFEAVNERAGTGRVLRAMGIVHNCRGNHDMAMTCYEKAFKIGEELGDILGMAKNANNIGIVHNLQGDYKATIRWYQKSLQLSQKLGDKLNKSKVLNNIGECWRFQGDYKAAMTYYQESLQISEDLGDKPGIAITLGNIGHVYKAKGDYEMAVTSYDRTIVILRELGDQYFLSGYSIGKAEALFSLQRYKEAQALNAEALQIAEGFGPEEDRITGKVLSVKIDIALGNKEALHGLYDMLQHTQDNSEKALLHYELWKMTSGEDHRQNALDLYQSLYATIPKIEYKTRMEEMQGK